MQGGQGIVQIIEINGVKYACKHLLLGSNSDEDSIKRFLREIKIAQKIVSPNVIKVIEYGTDNDGPYYVMPLYSYNLGQFINNNRDVLFYNPELQQSIIMSVLSGVKALHAAGIIHRDLKPGNILMNSPEDIVVCDFGFSKDMGSSSSYTNTGDRFGTPKYMSPEQMDDSKHVDQRTDIYALGEILNDITGRIFNCAPNQLSRVADRAKCFSRENRYPNVSELERDIMMGYTIWIKENAGISSQKLIDEIDRGDLTTIELLTYVDQIIRNPFYSPGDADVLSAVLTEKKYKELETNDETLCFELFEHIWKDFSNAWNNDYNKIDEMTSLVRWYWSISQSPLIKGYNLAQLIDLARDGNRFAAMYAMADMIAEMSGDEQIIRVLLRYTSSYTIKANYKKIGKRPPAWLG